jgi:hypothetical protein
MTQASLKQASSTRPKELTATPCSTTTRLAETLTPARRPLEAVPVTKGEVFMH